MMSEENTVPSASEASQGADSVAQAARADKIAALAIDSKAIDVVVIDVREKSDYTDFLVIASGTSDRHVRSIAENVRHSVERDLGLEIIGAEGMCEGRWALVDTGEVVVHVFHQFTREEYDLEDLWCTAPSHRIEAESAK